MISKRWALVALVAATPASAAPVDQTCKIAGIFATNDLSRVEPLIAEIGTRWPAPVRTQADEQLKTLLGADAFVGANVYPVTKLGDDYEEHMIVLRQRAGELSAIRVSYEWTSTGPQVVRFEYKQQVAELTVGQNWGTVSPIECP